MALADARFKGLTAKEYGLLLTGDSASIQIVAKGTYRRSNENERLIHELLNSKKLCYEIWKLVNNKNPITARLELHLWTKAHGYQIEWSNFHSSIDFIYRNYLYPWSGIYITLDKKNVITIVGNKKSNSKSIVYINNILIPKYSIINGSISWSIQNGVPFDGFWKLDLQSSGSRRLVGKMWSEGQTSEEVDTIIAQEADPERQLIAERSMLPIKNTERYGQYILRSSGRFSRIKTSMTLTKDAMLIDNKSVDSFTISGNSLRWKGGIQDYHIGELSFVRDPISRSIEVFGECRSYEESHLLKCHGALLLKDDNVQYDGPSLPHDIQSYLLNIARTNLENGGLMLWYKWERFHLTNTVVAKIIVPII